LMTDVFLEMSKSSPSSVGIINHLKLSGFFTYHQV
jgi:hypothetical protein